MSDLQGFSIIGGGKKENRVENEVYPTPIEVTHALMLLLKELDYNHLTVWEPACDIGGMSKVIEKYGHTVYSSDLRYTGFGDGGLDYLLTPDTSHYAIITNPPFNLSMQFIEKALTEARIVCMVLKSQYWHAAKRANFFKENTPAYVCPLTWRPDFSNGGNPTMDVHWTIWIRGINQAKYQPLNKPKL